ncbi:hypothetical protein Pla100_27720 [Neorhodopirellula pilleata]|uniref:Uncharacterized protein n=1 Tax=Neorhodopirellula pilleata TaxID=2714738 RepID=A0A5C6AAW7_9BACT|nr:hypothetical protein Pla100_27720 [Neorhodopirellula pilleata]
MSVDSRSRRLTWLARGGWGLDRSQAACRVSATAATQPTIFRNSLLATRFYPRVAAWPFERVECGWGLDRSQAACRVSAIAATQPTFFRNSLLASTLGLPLGHSSALNAVGDWIAVKQPAGSPLSLRPSLLSFGTRISLLPSGCRLAIRAR